MQLKLEMKNKYKCVNLNNVSYGKCHAVSQAFVFVFMREFWLLYIYIFFYLDGVENKGNRCETIKHTFRNTTYSKTIKISLEQHVISIISMASKIAEAD